MHFCAWYLAVKCDPKPVVCQALLEGCLGLAASREHGHQRVAIGSCMHREANYGPAAAIDAKLVQRVSVMPSLLLGAALAQKHSLSP